MRPNPYRRPASPQARRAEMMRAAAIRKRAFGYSNLDDGMRRAEKSISHLNSAASSLEKAIRSARDAMETMGTIAFQGSADELSDVDAVYSENIDDWGESYGERIDQELRPLENVRDLILDAIDDGKMII